MCSSLARQAALASYQSIQQQAAENKQGSSLLLTARHTEKLSQSREAGKDEWVDSTTCNGDHAISVHADYMVSGGTGSVPGIRVSGQGPDPAPC